MWETNIKSKGKVIFRGQDGADKVEKETEPAVIHEVPLKNLLPGHVYKYNIASEDGMSGATSSWYAVKTVPVVPAPWSFIVHGDICSGLNPSTRDVMVGRILKEKAGLKPEPAFAVLTGDMVSNGKIYEQWGESFFGPEKELLAVLPVWPCRGNHDMGEWYFKFFSLPGEERWYSFDYLNAHFIALDSFSDFKPGSKQYAWLEGNLKSAKSGWIFVFFHKPPYSSGPHCALDERGVPREKAVEDARLHLDPLFQKYKVDMVFSGHNHCYERSLKEKVYYITAGSVGARLCDRKNDNPYSQVFIKTNDYIICDIDGTSFKMRVKESEEKTIDTLEIRKTE